MPPPDQAAIARANQLTSVWPQHKWYALEAGRGCVHDADGQEEAVTSVDRPLLEHA